jgi:hypothetical protein
VRFGYEGMDGYDEMGKWKEACLSFAHKEVLCCKCLRKIEWILHAKVPL